MGISEKFGKGKTTLPQEAHDLSTDIVQAARITLTESYFLSTLQGDWSLEEKAGDLNSRVSKMQIP